MLYSIKIFVLLWAFSLGLCENCGGNCYKNNCPSCPCGFNINIVKSDEILA